MIYLIVLVYDLFNCQYIDLFNCQIRVLFEIIMFNIIMTQKQLKKPIKKPEVKVPYIIKTEDGNLYLIADKVVSVKKYNSYILKHNLFKHKEEEETLSFSLKEEEKEKDEIKINLNENITVSF